MGKIQRLFGEPLGQVITPRVFSLMKPISCVHSKRLRVYQQNAHMVYTCGRVARTHGAGQGEGERGGADACGEPGEDSGVAGVRQEEEVDEEAGRREFRSLPLSDARAVRA